MSNVVTLLLYAFLSQSSGGLEHSYTSANFHASDSIIVTVDSLNNTDSVNSIPTTANLISFAQTLKGVPYKYGCSDPELGFDCSGFVKYVFNRFQINVPRSSIGFTNIGKEVKLQNAMPGDIILFTGTDSKLRKVGHVGIIIQSSDSIVFIHASSGKTYAVTETSLNDHYKKRFLKVIRML